MHVPFSTPVVLRSNLPPEEVVRRLQELTRSRHGFTEFHLYDLEIEGRVWANEFWVEHHSRRRSASRRLTLSIFPEGTGSRLAGHFSIEAHTIAALAIWTLAFLLSLYREWSVDSLGTKFLFIAVFLSMPISIGLFQLWRSLRHESKLLEFVEEALNASVIADDLRSDPRASRRQ